MEEHYIQKYLAILDSIFVGLTERFEPDEISQYIRKVEKFLIGEESSVEYMLQHYGSDIAPPRQMLHRDRAINRSKTEGVSLQDTQGVVEFLKKDEMFGSMIPELHKFLRNLLTLPVSSCTAERSLSGLKRFKSYLRSEMSKERLNAVAIMKVHKDDVMHLSTDEIMNYFVNINTLRKNTFWVSKYPTKQK